MERKREKKSPAVSTRGGDVRRTGNRVVAISSTVTTNSGQVEVRKSSEGGQSGDETCL